MPSKKYSENPSIGYAADFLFERNRMPLTRTR